MTRERRALATRAFARPTSGRSTTTRESRSFASNHPSSSARRRSRRIHHLAHVYAVNEETLSPLHETKLLLMRGEDAKIRFTRE